MNMRFDTKIFPTDIKVFYENKRPYIAYKGIFYEDGIEYEIEIPKMDMVINAIEQVSEINYHQVFDGTGAPIKELRIPVRNEFFAEHNVAFQIRTLKAQMTKAEIEKELGYKVDIVG